MQLSPLEKTVSGLLAPSLAGMGYLLVRVKFFERPGGRTLQVMAERGDGKAMTVDDCAEISHNASALLDVHDPVPGAYELEISSPGIDRPLTRPEDFAAYAGHEAKLETAWPIEGRKRFKGELLGLDGEDARIRVDGREYRVPLDAIAQAKLVLTDALMKKFNN